MTGVYRKRWQPYRPAPRRARRRRVVGGAAAGAPLSAGTASFVSSGPGGISVTTTAPSGGTPAYTYQWQRSTTSGSGFSDLSGATSASHTDTTASAGTLYYYRCVYGDAAAGSATSGEVSAQVYSGGSLGGSAVFPVFGSAVIRGAMA